MKMHMVKWASLLACASVTQLASAVTVTSDTIIQFQGAGGTVTGPSIVQAITNGGLYDGMFVIRDFDPTGYTGTMSFDGTTSDDGVEFLLHSSRLERLEAVTLRTDSSPRSDEVSSLNNKILVPRTASYTDGQGTGFFGAGSVTFINGQVANLQYSIGAGALASFDFLFQGAGVDASLESISLNSGIRDDVFATFIEDGADPDSTEAYGQNSNGYLQGSTDNATTFFEASEPGLCTAKYSGGTCGGIVDPFNAGIGLNSFKPGQDLYLYDLGNIEASITAVPVPAAFWLFGSALGGLLISRRKA